MQASGLDIAWAAGLFEGEGCITFTTGSNGKLYPILQLAMTDLDVVLRFSSVWGVGRINTTERPGSLKTMHTWRLYRTAQKRDVLRAMLPYLGERRKAKALEALAVCEYIYTGYEENED